MGRRRYTKRGKGRKRYRRNPVNAISVSRALNATKDYIFEDRTPVIQTVNNWIRYGIMPLIFNTYQPCLNNTLNQGASDLAQDMPGIDTIVTQAGHEASANSATDTGYKVRVFKQHVTYKLRNLSNHPAFLTLYDFISKVDNEDPNQADTLIIEDLVRGWNNKMQTNQVAFNDEITSGVVVSWDETKSATSTPEGYCDVKSSQLYPAQSYNFYKNYKLLRKREFKLNPGDDLKWSLSGPYMDAEPSTKADGSSTPALFKNKTKFTMYRVHGAMGKDKTNDNLIGFMQTDISIETLFRAKTYRIQAVERSICMAAPSIDDASAATLEGPSDFIVTDHNQ